MNDSVPHQLSVHFIRYRLPIIQGGSHTFVAPIVAMLTLEQFRCPTHSKYSC